MELNGVEIDILKVIQRMGGSSGLVNVKKKFFGGGAWDLFKTGINNLKNKGFICVDEFEISLLPVAEQFLSEYEKTGQKAIFNDNYKLAVLGFLYEVGDHVHIDSFPELLKRHAPVAMKTSVSETYNLMHYLGFSKEVKNYVEDKDQRYWLNDSGRSYYEYLVKLSEVSHAIERQPFIQQTFDHSIKVGGDAGIINTAEIKGNQSSGSFKSPLSANIMNMENQPIRNPINKLLTGFWNIVVKFWWIVVPGIIVGAIVLAIE